MAPPRSHIWNYFQTYLQDDSKMGKCKACEKTVKCGVSGTNGLRVHLRSYHSEIYEEFIRLRDDKSFNDLGSEQEDDQYTNVKDTKKQEPKNEKVILSGNEFPSDTVSAFKDMLEDEHFTNVTLVTDGNKRIKAHKIILSSFSPFFKEMLMNNPHPHPLVYLRGVKQEYLQAIINFMYLGQAKIDLHEVNDFLRVASDLQVKGLHSSENSINGQEESATEESIGDKMVEEAHMQEEETSQKNAITFQEDSISYIKQESPEKPSESKPISPSSSLNMNSENDDVYDEVSCQSPNNVEKANVTCEFPDCKYVAAHKRYLREHRQAIHEGIKYQCELCDDKGSTKNDLKKHIQIKHIEEKYPCHQCEFMANSIIDLSEHHSKTHASE